jgi:hypothetical protein
MIVRIAIVAIVLIAGQAWAALQLPPDDLSKAYEAALTELCAGQDRQDIADRLKPVVNRGTLGSASV